MIGEVEDKVDKGMALAGAAHIQRKVLQQETSNAILAATTLPPQALAAPGKKDTNMAIN